jgi:hypothetical protein
MDPAQRIVTRMPLRDLWRDAGLLDAHRHGRVISATMMRVERISLSSRK